MEAKLHNGGFTWRAFYFLPQYGNFSSGRPSKRIGRAKKDKHLSPYSGRQVRHSAVIPGV